MEKKNEEAATLQKKKTTISKGKIKKTIKNVLCRPDVVYWPKITAEQEIMLEAALSKNKVEIPHFEKPHWKVLKTMPKDLRPKQPKIKKVEGLIFGLSECTEALKSKKCSAVIINSTVNPRALVHPLIVKCNDINVPVLCMTGLKTITSKNFGIPTCCLGIERGLLQELQSVIEDITKQQKLEKVEKPLPINVEVQQNTENTQDDEKMEVDPIVESTVCTEFTYLHRASKKTRVFNPSSEKPTAKKKHFGQDFIEFSTKPEQAKSDNKAYMTMTLKRITNNQNRKKKK